jgi:hypothetical protein
MANCYAVQAAAEAYAAENEGRYPDQSIEGELIAHLPQGTRLENPYTNLLNVPAFRMATFPGETGYIGYYGAYVFYPVGYLITGFGADGELIRLSNLPHDIFYFEEQTIANCYTVLDAVEAFAADNNGIYPSNVDVHINALGKTVLDYLGGLLVNPYTLLAQEPVNGVAAFPGQTGYSPIIGGSRPVGCWITGYGRYSPLIAVAPLSREDQSVKSSAYDVWKAVEDFAAENNGGYPNDVDAHLSLSGNTVIDLLRNGLQGWNPYTEQHTEPRNGLVKTRGQVGYIPISNGGANEGYIINGWGLFAEVVRLEK